MSTLDTSDKVFQKHGKALESRSFNSELGAWIVSWNYELDNGHALPVFTYGLVDQKIENERNISRARITIDNATFVQLTNKTREQAENILREFAVSWVETREVLNHQNFPALEFLSLGAECTSINTANNLWKIRTATAWLALTEKKYDEELGLAITITREVIDLQAGGYALPANTAGNFYEEVKVDTRRAIRTTTTIDSYNAVSNPNPGKDVYADEQYSFPAILAHHVHATGVFNVAAALEYNTRLEAANKRSVFWININVREAFTAPVMMRIVEEIITPAQLAVLKSVGAVNVTAYGANAGFYAATLTGDLGTSTTRAKLFVPRPRDINYDGLLFNLHIPNVLTDGFFDAGGGGSDTRIIATTAVGDTYYGAVTEELTVLPSFPTASAYIALIGSAVCIEDSISMWKHGAFKRKRVIIQLQ